MEGATRKVPIGAGNVGFQFCVLIVKALCTDRKASEIQVQIFLTITVLSCCCSAFLQWLLRSKAVTRLQGVKVTRAVLRTLGIWKTREEVVNGTCVVRTRTPQLSL